jgi:hypothetical protein
VSAIEEDDAYLWATVSAWRCRSSTTSFDDSIDTRLYAADEKAPDIHPVVASENSSRNCTMAANQRVE